jgi:hypothetical protein
MSKVNPLLRQFCLLFLLAISVSAGAAQHTSFDHFKTGFELSGEHCDLQCESCHQRQQFSGTPRTCQLCHETNSFMAASFRPPEHIQTSGDCRSCHNNVIEDGKPGNHLATTQDCVACHTTIAWTPASFSHAGITNNCQSCHNNVIGDGKDPGHFQTSLDCNVSGRTHCWRMTH